MRVVREAIGPDIKLMCDINQRWRPEQAIDIARRCEEFGLFWLEDVVHHEDYQGMARVNAALSTPIAGGEYVWGIVPFRHMIEARSVPRLYQFHIPPYPAASSPALCSARTSRRR